MSSAGKVRQPVETGVSGWAAIAPRQFRAQVLAGRQLADWLIVGAGFGGLSAARRLRQLRPHDRIVVLDALEVAEGASGRNSGFMIDVPHNLASGNYSVGGAASSQLEIRQNRLAIAFAAQAAEEYRMPAATFDPAGKINVAATERGMALNQGFAESLRQIGEASEALDAAQMRDITGTDYYLGGVHMPGAAMIQPADYIRRLAQGLAGRIDLFERSPVRALRRLGAVWEAVSDHGSVQAPKVILAVNGHIESFGHFRHRLIHVYTYASMTAAIAQAPGADRWALLPADPMGATLRKITLDGQSRLVIRTHFTYNPDIRVSAAQVARIAARQRQSFDARFPALKGIPLEYSWAGALCLSTNHAPAFGEVEPGLYSACCENGLGTVKSTLAGMMAAELATGTDSEPLRQFRRQPPPGRLPPGPVAWLGVNAVIRWHQLRAGREG
ncbi:NAD(P)/FAD-dependent oxidoreductase [Castellaniella hirudinis]|uniref:NAD(P)/FAD-dependent oxidoreductase n=1 Tax=Castellaniella hirudinis TaxID=1144617 RepID=UPI0039C0F5C4